MRGFGNRRSRKGDPAEVPMTPLIDAVFLLLVFFLVATMFKKQIKDIDITPPESSSAYRMKMDDSTLVIGIDAEGDLYWQGEPTTANILNERLREIGATKPDQNFRVDADQATPFHRVAMVLDLLAFRNLNTVGIRTYDERYNR